MFQLEVEHWTPSAAAAHVNPAALTPPNPAAGQLRRQALLDGTASVGDRALRPGLPRPLLPGALP